MEVVCAKFGSFIIYEQIKQLYVNINNTTIELLVDSIIIINMGISRDSGNKKSVLGEHM